MRLFGLWFMLFVLVVGLPAWAFGAALEAPLDMDKVNAAAFDGKPGPMLALKTQILLDRNRYSPGVIDGIAGDATQIALKAFQTDNGLEPSGKIDAASFAKLNEDQSAPV